MSKEFNNWQEVIIDFFENRISKSKLYKARKYIADKDIDIKKEKDVKKLETLKEAKEKKQQELRQLRKDAPETEIRVWIKNYYNKELTIKTIKATHVLKFTHTSSDPGGLLLKEKSDDLLLTTSSLKRKLTLDLAHKNGADISISRFLGLQLSKEMIIDLILKDDFKFLEPFKENKEQLKKWQDGFKNLVEETIIRLTADKAKQLYFPIEQNTKEKYHLITPLLASSLANEVNTAITDIKYGEKQKKINECRKNKIGDKKEPKYHSNIYANFPNLAVQNFDKKHPNNVSMLNADRKGEVFLFSAQPPTWQSKLKPPISKKSLFDNYYYSINTADNIKYLVDFLLRNESVDLSIRDPEKQKWLEKWTSYIVDDFWFFVGNIHNFPSGWSNAEGTKLKLEHQYLLDPYKEDKEFQANRKETDWQKIVVNDFSTWLNKQLKNKDKKFTPQKEYSRTWKKVMEKELREYNQIIEAGIDMEVGL